MGLASVQLPPPLKSNWEQGFFFRGGGGCTQAIQALKNNFEGKLQPRVPGENLLEQG